MECWFFVILDTIAWRDRLPSTHALLDLSLHLEALTHHLVFACEMKFSMELTKNVTYQSGPSHAHCLLNLCQWPFIGLWLNIRHKNKSESNHMQTFQNSRYKWTTCPRKGCLLRFELNSTLLQIVVGKAWSYLWHDSDLIATKVCS